jgi:hypothetical protein
MSDFNPQEQLRLFIQRDEQAVNAINCDPAGYTLEAKYAFMSGRLEDVSRLVMQMLRNWPVSGHD